MGANCCVVAKEKTLPYGDRFEISNNRNIRNSPSWSFVWDHRTHIEDIMDNPIRPEIKRGAGLETEGLSGRGDHVDTFRSQKSVIQTGTSGHFNDGAGDRSTDGNSSPEGKKSIKSSVCACASDTKPSLSIPSTPSSSAFRSSPSSPRSHPLPSDPTSSVKACHSPGYQFTKQDCDSRLSAHSKTLNDNSSPEASKSFGVSQCGSSDAWSMRTFSELVASSQRERESSDNENHSSISSKAARPNNQLSSSHSADFQTCGVCLKLLKHRSPRKVCDEIPVVSVLVCGHVYHADCLESVTPETDRYDPSCPVCTYGDKCGPSLLPKAEMKARNKISRIRVIDIDGDSSSGHEKHKKGSRLASSSSKRSTFSRSFLRRHSSMRPQAPLQSGSESDSSSRIWGFWTRHRRA
ncbi:hypothetical protein J5N97_007402 [Dioscorea zingiberensis]|uniref:RING-type domain-containing protein n=1 Tax=Dioscorea zingiberensis TaxID=325984 RepID=A0A9D5DBQ0_9LILI|nr:hypothetical protein J5N97_007402 [Dioscorea zingiberensis]